MINNAYDLYQFLIKQGGLKPYENSYDINFKESFKTEFKIKTPKDLIGVTTEEFLIFFFNSSEAYNVMMSDVINMFKRASATAENDENNIKLDIVFDRIKDKLKIDLSDFIEKYSTSQVIVQKNIPVFKSYTNIWDMARLLYSIKVNEEEERSGKKEYCYRLVKSEWEQFNSFEKSDNTELNKYVDLLKLVLDKYYYTLGKYLSIGKLELDSNKVLVVLDEFKAEKVNYYMFENLTLDEFCRMESDDFTSTIVKYLKIVINNKKYQEEVLGGLKSFFSHLNIISVEEKTNLFKEYLKLPIWKLRHELYSIWVMSQIVDISDDFEINTQNGKLLFAFKATHQASIKDGQGLSIDLWSELKTKADISLIGKGRSKSIQPDYTIVQGDSSKAEDAIIVIECKQYKKASYSNFSKAMIDYSNVHKKAYVFLVNYGSLTSNFDSKFSKEFEKNQKNKNKPIAIGDFNPEFPKVIKRFKESCRAKIFKNHPLIDNSDSLVKSIANTSSKRLNNVGQFDFKNGFQIRLTWSEAIQDLDLYLKCADLTICFSNTKGDIKGNTIIFRNDVRTTPRSNSHEYEIIDIIGYLVKDFSVNVKKYSTESVSIGKSKAIVEIVYNNNVYHRFECPENNNTDVWDVFKVENGKIFEIK
ncbi:hypothetical protein [Myroides marinus]|uniref:hypothetical protein n=1 Tax=Myroides marinus TaxID=703342 RepID=UPI0025750302|nr:hypothetical protein [Myroides marinus]MDM1377037.1 hypothetical protein [Myroides marinus]